MPNLGPKRGRTSIRSAGPPGGHRCRQCHHELHLVRFHESPARLGAHRLTEFYQCVRPAMPAFRSIRRRGSGRRGRVTRTDGAMDRKLPW